MHKEEVTATIISFTSKCAHIYFKVKLKLICVVLCIYGQICDFQKEEVST